jgi:excisionase family DNA binding protein
MEKIYTVDEVAAIEDVTIWTVREWIKAGQLIATKRGRAYQIKESDLKTYLESKHG